MKFKLFLSVLLASSSVLAADVQQQAGQNFAGLALGVSRPTGSNSGGIPLRFAYGLEYSYALSKDFAVGGFASRNNGPVSSGSPIDLAITRVGAQAIYNPLHDFFVDVRAGVAFVDASAHLGNSVILKSDTNHPLFTGIGAGFIVSVMDKITFSPSIHFTHFFSNGDSEHFEATDLTGAFRYQF